MGAMASVLRHNQQSPPSQLPEHATDFTQSPSKISPLGSVVVAAETLLNPHQVDATIMCLLMMVAALSEHNTSQNSNFGRSNRNGLDQHYYCESTAGLSSNAHLNSLNDGFEGRYPHRSTSHHSGGRAAL